MLDRDQMQLRIDALEAQANLDHEQITALLAEVAADREQIGKMLADAVLGEEQLERLVAAGVAEQAEIERLLASGLSGEAQIEDLIAARSVDKHEIEHLRVAIESARVIGAAVGIVMERYSIDRDKAFLYLVRLSQDSNRRLRDLAAEVVADDESV